MSGQELFLEDMLKPPANRRDKNPVLATLTDEGATGWAVFVVHVVVVTEGGVDEVEVSEPESPPAGFLFLLHSHGQRLPDLLDLLRQLLR